MIARLLVLGPATMMAGCMTADRTCELACDEAMATVECDAAADAGLAALRSRPTDLGELRRVEVRLGDCDRLARSAFEPQLADPSLVRCWSVLTEWQRGQPSVTVAQTARGELLTFP